MRTEDRAADLLQATERLADGRLRDAAGQAGGCGAASSRNCQEDRHLGQREGHLHLRGHYD